MHASAVAAVLFSPLPTECRGLLVGLVLAGLTRHLRRLREPPDVAALRVGRDGRWSLLWRDGREQPVTWADATLSSPLMVWLAWTDASGWRRLLVLPDSLPDQQYRALRVSLRITAAQGGDLRKS